MAIKIPRGPFQPTWKSLKHYTIPRWYENGKFGIFIHWGVYSVPAFGSEWYPRNMYEQGTAEYEHHKTTFGDHSKFGYKDFIPQFGGENFDPDQWAGLFRQSGARFVVPVAEHHDGFAMYDCDLSNWNAVLMGPRRDIIGDLAESVRRQGMVFGVSSHRAEHWWFFCGGMQFDSDVQDPKYAGLYGPAQLRDTQPNEQFLDDWLARTCELVDKYQPQLIWFDWWIEQPAFESHLKRFAAYYYNRGAEWDRGVAINYKKEAYPEQAAVFDVERGQLSDIRPLFWQSDTAVAKNSWGYIDGLVYKTPESVIGDLVDIVSKNGALLLNIAPRPDGTIPEGDQKILRSVGRWLTINGESIYDSRPWKVFGEGPTEVVSGSFNDTKRAAFTAKDIRFTTRGDTLYATALGNPEKAEVSIQSLGTNMRLYNAPIGAVSLVGAEGDLKWSRTAAGLKVKLPDKKRGDGPFVLKIKPADAGASPYTA